MITKEYTLKFIDKTGHMCATCTHGYTIKHALEEFNLHNSSNDVTEIIEISLNKIDRIPDKTMEQINAFLLTTKNDLDQQ